MSDRPPTVLTTQEASRTGVRMKTAAARTAIALLVTIPLAVVMVYTGLLAALAILQQVLAGFVDLSEASWTRFLNPAVIVGLESPGGTGGPLDALFGGPGAPGGTVPRYLVFMVAGAIAYGSFFGLTHLWAWARRDELSA